MAVFLTRDQGMLRGVAYGAQKSRGRFGSALEPLTHLKLTFRRRETQELAVIENCEIIRASPAYRVGWEEQLYCGYLAELVVEFTREQIAGDRLFRLVLAVLDAMEQVSAEMLARYFEFWLLRLEGVLPSLSEILPDDLAVRTQQMLARPPAEAGNHTFTTGELRDMERVTARLIENHLEKPLKAKRMLKELL